MSILKIILEGKNDRVWSTLVEQTLREKKLWLHITGMAIVRPAPRVASLAIHEVVAPDGVLTVASAIELT